MVVSANQRTLTPRQIELGYHVCQHGDKLYLYYRGEPVAFCLATAIPGVLTEAAWQHSFFHNLLKEAEGNQRRIN